MNRARKRFRTDGRVSRVSGQGFQDKGFRTDEITPDY
jgi:hypothetical protein